MNTWSVSRRRFLKETGTLAGVRLAAASFPLSLSALGLRSQDQTRADYTLHIKTSPIEIAPKRIVSAITYNGEFPGPLLRFKEGPQVTIDIYNDTDTPEQLHWHGQKVPVDVDGAAEEGTPFIPAQGKRRIAFTPSPAGFRFYHTHNRAGANLATGQYGGEVGPVYIEPAQEPGRYDREVFLVLKEFEPTFSRGGDMAQDFLNGRMLSHSEPIKVRQGERVLFHILNGSATEIRSLALPGHSFEVVTLDGNPVPNPTSVPVLWLGTAERISAIVHMTHAGVWILGDLADDDRRHGMGIVVEYAGRTGKAQWIAPSPFKWNYARFAKPGATAPPPDETFEMTFAKDNAAEDGFNRWTINGIAYPMTSEVSTAAFHLKHGKRYRLRMRNASDDIHPIHLHRHSFELTSLAGKPTAGILKDVVMLGGYQEAEVDFVADNPGLTLFHCHQQLHMDFGFMTLFDYV